MVGAPLLLVALQISDPQVPPPATLSERTATSPSSVPPMPAVPASIPPMPAPAGDRAPTRWYGGVGLAGDAVAAAAILGGLRDRGSEPLLFAGATTYLMTGLVNHGIHRRGGRVAASFAIRASVLAATYLGALRAAGTCGLSDGGGPCDEGFLAAGAAAMIGAALFDDLVLSREPVARPAATAAAWSPTVAVAPGRAYGGLGLAF